MKRFLLFWVLAAIFAAVMATPFLALKRGWVERMAALAPAGRAVWQQGVWPFQDRLAEAVKSRVAGVQPGHPYRVLVRVDPSAVTQYRFSSLSAEGLVLALNHSAIGTDRVSIATSPGSDKADLIVSVAVKSYKPGTNEDLLSGIVTFTPAGGSPADESFEIRCPAHGRSWFVRCACPPLWLLIGAVVLTLLGGGIGIWGASDAFKGEYEGTWRMLGSVLALGMAVYLLIAYLCEPSLGRFGIPRRHVTVALDMSDAVRFPVVPGASQPVAGKAGTNDLCRFVSLCVSRIGKEVESPGGKRSRGGFKRWVNQLLGQVGQPTRQSDMLSVAEGMDIVHSLPAADDETTNRPPVHATLAEVPALLAAGHRGDAPTFFLPWRGRLATNDNELVVAFMTGEPSSWRQAAWLRDNRNGLRDRRPRSVKVLSVVLPAVSRSEAEEWGASSRFRNIASVSDTVITLGDQVPAMAAQSGAPVVVEEVPVFTPGQSADAPPGSARRLADLDAERTRTIRADDEEMRTAAGRIAERARGLADVRETYVFQASEMALYLTVIMAACLALFLGLQRELRLLVSPKCAFGRLMEGGAVVGLVVGLLVALAIGYATSEPARWRTSVGPLAVLWALTTLWYAGIWLPLLLGRRLGQLPRPTKTLKMTWLYGSFCAAMGSMILVALAAGLCHGVGTEGGIIGPALGVWLKRLPWLPTLASGFLAFMYGWTCFHRTSRRRVFWAGHVFLLLLFILPWWVQWIPMAVAWGGVSLSCLVVIGMVVAAIIVPEVLAWFAARKAIPVVRTWSLGGSAYACLLGALVISVIMYHPLPLGRGCMALDGVLDWAAAALAGGVALTVVLWLVGRVWREARG